MIFRIATWNINGLRAALVKDALKWKNDAALDILCLQEIKVRPEQLTEEQRMSLDPLQTYWNPAERPGYSGVATLCVREPEMVQLGMGITQFDGEGRIVLTRHPGFLLFNVYFPNGQRDHGRLTYKLNFYAELLEICDQLHREGENIIICGDFNTAHKEIDLRHPRANQNTSGFLPEERAWIDEYVAHGLVDAYRYLYPDKVEYTWWTYIGGARQRNVGWRLDYFMVSESLLPQVQDVQILGDVMGSDHCPVVLDLSLD